MLCICFDINFLEYKHVNVKWNLLKSFTLKSRCLRIYDRKKKRKKNPLQKTALQNSKYFLLLFVFFF